jgi:hypothetical protein
MTPPSGFGVSLVMPASSSAFEQLMQVGIDQAGHDCLARKLDHLRVRADVGSDRRIGADCEKAPIPYGDGLRDAPVLVDRNDPAAAQHEIGGLGEG